MEFNNDATLKLAEEFNFTWIFSSPRHHETFGAVERANQTIMNILKKLSKFGELSWERLLKNAVFAYNISFHRALNASPYILKFGKLPLLDVDEELEQEEILISKTETIQARDLHFEKYKPAIEKGIKTVEYNLKKDDKVLVYNPPLSDKFKPKWYPGFVIKDKILPDAYLVHKNGKEYRFNKVHVKLDKSV